MYIFLNKIYPPRIIQLGQYNFLNKIAPYHYIILLLKYNIYNSYFEDISIYKDCLTISKSLKFE